MIELGYNQNSQNNAIAYLDKLTLDIPKNLALEEKPLLLRNSEMTKNVISKFRIVSDNSNSRIWDITQMEKVDDIAYTRSNSVIEFTSATTKNREFYIFDASQIIPVESFNEIENQNLKGYTQSEFFIITDPVFVSEAQRLADFRQSNDGLTSNVITTASIYYEFSSGRQDITAIRDFFKVSLFIWQPQIRTALWERFI